MRKIVMYMIIACVVLLLTNEFQEGFAGKYILKSKIVPPVCPKCPECPSICDNSTKDDKVLFAPDTNYTGKFVSHHFAHDLIQHIQHLTPIMNLCL